MCNWRNHGDSRSCEKERQAGEAQNDEAVYLPWILEDWFIGMTASILLVLSADPDSGIQLVILSIISGYGGEAVLRSFDFVREMNSGGEPAESKRQTKTPPE